MRNCENPKDIHMTTEQRAIMNIAREGMQECHETECRNCRDRHIKNMSVLECYMQKITRKLIEAGYAHVVHGEWKLEWDAEKDPKKYFVRIVCSNCGLKTGEKSNFCPKCGAKMDGGKANE